LEADLANEQMLKVLGFCEAHVIEAKNKDPLEMTERMPVIITSNHKTKELYAKKKDDKAPLLRRLFVVRFQSQWSAQMDAS
jgi:hypothetical protein